MAENTEDSLELVEDTGLEEMGLEPQEPTESNDAQNTQDQAAETSSEQGNLSDEPEFGKKKKKNVLKLALFGVVGFLALVLVSGMVMYFLGFFDTPEPPKEPMAKEEAQVKQVEKEEDYEFNLKDINTKKLNQELAVLTNKNYKEQEKEEKLEKIEQEKKILEEEKKKQTEALEEEKRLSEEKMALESKKEELEKEKSELEGLRLEALELKEQMLKDKLALEEEKEKLILNQINLQNTKSVLEEEKMKLEQENIALKQQNDETTKAPMQEEMMMQEEDHNDFLLLINVATIKGSLYKEYLDSVLAISRDVKLCRDDVNNIELFYGPFENKKQRNALLDKLMNHNFENAYGVELTKEEFNKRCNY